MSDLSLWQCGPPKPPPPRAGPGLVHDQRTGQTQHKHSCFCERHTRTYHEIKADRLLFLSKIQIPEAHSTNKQFHSPVPTLAESTVCILEYTEDD